MTFKDIDIKLTEADYRKLSKLEEDGDFLLWREIIEKFMLKTALNLMSGKAVPKDVDPLSYMRGRYDMYIKMMRPIDASESIIKELENENTEDKSN